MSTVWNYLSDDTLQELFPDAEIEVAENGQVAVDKVKENAFDIVLMDINMSVMDGLEATRAIRTLDGNQKGIAIMAMTASDSKAEVERCKDAGMNDFITKPFDPDNLKQKIEKLVSTIHQ